MIWLDIVALLAIVIVVGLEGWRKFGKALFDAAGVFIALRLAHLAQPGLASLVEFSPNADANQGIAFAVVFGILVVLAVVASKYLYAVTLLSLPEAFEGFIGALLGIVSGLIIAHAIVWTVYTANGGAEKRENPYADTIAVEQLVEWDAYHQVLYQLRHLGE